MKRKLKFIIPGIYLLIGIVVWIDFSRLPPDGLANVGIALYTLPAFLLARLLTERDFPFFEGNYYTAHAIYFSISVLLLAVVFYFIIYFIHTLFQHRTTKKGQE